MSVCVRVHGGLKWTGIQFRVICCKFLCNHGHDKALAKDADESMFICNKMRQPDMYFSSCQ